MSDENKITLTREQWTAWAKSEIPFQTPDESFDSLKAFIEKPKRRYFNISRHNSYASAASSEAWSNPLFIQTAEYFPGDILMTKEEFTSFIDKAWNRAIGPVDVTGSYGPRWKIFKEVLGLT